MKKILVFFAAMLISASAANAGAFGGVDAGAINSQNVRDLRIHEVTSRVKAKDEAAMQEKRQAIQEKEQINSALKQNPQTVTSDIKSVMFVNNFSIPASELQAVIRDKINKAMTLLNISAIRKDVMTYYQKKGFYSAVATVSSQNFETGEIIIDVREGTKNSITIE